MTPKLRWVMRKTLQVDKQHPFLATVAERKVLQAYDEGSGNWVDVPLADEQATDENQSE